MNKFLIVFGVVVIVSISFFVFNGEDIRNYPPKSKTIIAFGDSLVFGTGSTKGNDFVSRVSREIGQPIENMGIPGNTTADGLSRIDTILQKKPGIVVLLLGGNDFLKKVPKNETFSNLRQIVSMIQESGSVVVILGVRGGILTDGYDEEFEKLARDTKTILVPNVLQGLLGDSRFMSDAVHPNDSGYEKISKKVSEALVTILE